MLPSEEASQRAAGIDSEIENFEGIVEDISNAKEEVREKYNELVEAWEDSWGWWKKNVFSRGEYEEEKNKIDEIWDNIEQSKISSEGINESLLELADRVINHHTPVISLFRISARWVEETYQRTSDVYSDIADPAHGRDLAEWGGQARGAYDDIVAQQNNAVGAARDVASEVSLWLSNVATGNVEFLSNVLTTLSDLADTLISEIGKIANTAGASVVWSVAEAIASAVSSGIDLLGTALENFASMASADIEADIINMDHSHFPDGEWPQAVSRP